MTHPSINSRSTQQWEADFSGMQMTELEARGTTRVSTERCESQTDGFSTNNMIQKGVFESSKAFWENASTEDRDSSETDFFPFCDERDETVSVVTPGSMGTSNGFDENRISNSISETTVVQKWDKIIRANHVTRATKPTEEDAFRVQPSFKSTGRVGVLNSANSTKHNSARLRRSSGLGDITNNFRSPMEEEFVEFASSTNNDTDLNSCIPKIKGQHSAGKHQIPNRSYGREDNFNPFGVREIISSNLNHKHTNSEEAWERNRRSFGLSDFVAGLDTPSASNRMRTQEEPSFEIKTGGTFQTPESKLKASRRVNNSGEKVKSLVGMWNQHIEENLSQSSGSPSTSTEKKLSMDSFPVTTQNVNVNHAQNKQDLNNLPARALVIVENPNQCDLFIGEAFQKHNDARNGEQLVIHRMLVKTEEIECECSSSIFSGNDELISFFLPKMGMACTCGRRRNLERLCNPHDPTALENILRPWQVEFLQTLDIRRGDEFVKNRHKSAGVMAKAMRHWRKKHGMTPFKTSSCATALSIWSKICKSYVRSVRRATGKQVDFGSALFAELSIFLDDLPEGPKRKGEQLLWEGHLIDIKPESEVEV